MADNSSPWLQHSKMQVTECRINWHENLSHPQIITEEILTKIYHILNNRLKCINNLPRTPRHSDAQKNASVKIPQLPQQNEGLIQLTCILSHFLHAMHLLTSQPLTIHAHHGKIRILKPLHMTTKVCGVTNGLCFPPRRATNRLPDLSGRSLIEVHYMVRVARAYIVIVYYYARCFI